MRSPSAAQLSSPLSHCSRTVKSCRFVFVYFDLFPSSSARQVASGGRCVHSMCWVGGCVWVWVWVWVCACVCACGSVRAYTGATARRAFSLVPVRMVPSCLSHVACTSDASPSARGSDGYCPFRPACRGARVCVAAGRIGASSAPTHRASASTKCEWPPLAGAFSPVPTGGPCHGVCVTG